MTSTLLRDAQQYPHLFRWNGALTRSLICKWSQAKSLQLPQELIELWVTVGGGDLFESETILQPYIDGDGNIDEENNYLSSSGFPSSMFAFHVGFVISAIQQPSGTIVAVDLSNFVVKSRFQRLDDWYVSLIRNEFSDRYGIS